MTSFQRGLVRGYLLGNAVGGLAGFVFFGVQYRYGFALLFLAISAAAQVVMWFTPLFVGVPSDG